MVNFHRLLQELRNKIFTYWTRLEFQSLESSITLLINIEGQARHEGPTSRQLISENVSGQIDRREHVSLCVLFVHEGKMNERLLAFVEVCDLTKSVVANFLLMALRHLSLNPGKWWATAKFPHVIQLHYPSHNLFNYTFNLLISQTCNVQASAFLTRQKAKNDLQCR